MCGPCPCVYRYRFVKGHGTKGLGTWVVPVYRYRFVKGHGTKGVRICEVLTGWRIRMRVELEHETELPSRYNGVFGNGHWRKS